MVKEVREHLEQKIIPFWKGLRDARGGYYGYVDHELRVDRDAVKGCILNSRITWFFSAAYKLLGDSSLLDEARHGYEFMKNSCFDAENGGVYWSVRCDGTPEDTTKHTYNQAFSIYALAAYYEVSGDAEALELALRQFELIESKCTDEIGYKEAFDRSFHEVDNDKLSENGVMAEKTMNTLLHVFEAYTELYRVSRDARVKARLEWIFEEFANKVYNPKLHRQEVFFDKNMNSLIDLYSYGHDIETSWLLDYGLEVLDEPKYRAMIAPITDDMLANLYQVAFDGHSLNNECDRGAVNTTSIWWVQAETVLGFVNGGLKHPEIKEYMMAARAEWDYIKEHMIDPRAGGEWFWDVDKNGGPTDGKPIVEPWKCPYHNGRMCIEVIKRLEGTELA